MDAWGPLHSLHASGAGDHVIDIPMWKLGLIAALLALPLAVAGMAGLHVNQPLVVAGVRCFLQLLLLGGVLRVIFANGSLLWVTMYIVFMMTVASIEAGSRPSLSYKVCAHCCSSPMRLLQQEAPPGTVTAHAWRALMSPQPATPHERGLIHIPYHLTPRVHSRNASGAVRVKIWHTCSIHHDPIPHGCAAVSTGSRIT